jgi:hypothetical protein
MSMILIPARILLPDDSLLKIAQKDASVRRFLEEDLVSIDDIIGRGSIVTVFRVTVKNRDNNGMIVEGVHQEIIKVRAPNAESLVHEIADKAIEVVELLGRSAKGRQKRNYEIARHILIDIREWVIQDIQDTSFLELDAKYQQAHIDYTASNGMAVRIPAVLQPNNKDLKRESLVQGLTLNKILKLKLSRKSINELITEEKDTQVRDFLKTLQQRNLTLDAVLTSATLAWAEDCARHLQQPIFRDNNNQPVYLLHSDIHFGNAILSPDLNTVYPIDRNYYLRLTQEDIDFISIIMLRQAGRELESLQAIVRYFLTLPENREVEIKESRSQRAIGDYDVDFTRVRITQDKNPFENTHIL